MSDFSKSVQWDTKQRALGKNLYDCTCVCWATPLDSSLFSFCYSAGPGGWSPSPDPAVGHCWTGKLYQSEQLSALVLWDRDCLQASEEGSV